MPTAFITDTTVPLPAFTKFGINHKPTVESPFGFFGTGLKYAVSIILRLGGKFQLFVDGVEYEFYLRKHDFRGKEFDEVMMKKKRGTKILSSRALPFTTELGKNWEMWQAYRELETNTRDEKGTTEVVSKAWQPTQTKGTVILIDLEGFDECPKTEQIFLEDQTQWSTGGRYCKAIIGRESKYLYYQGIRVYELKNPSRWTYDFLPGVVELSEDRTLKNTWSVLYDLGLDIQRFDRENLEELFQETEKPYLETHDMNYYEGHGQHFKAVALNSKSPSLISYTAVNSAPVAPDKVDVRLYKEDWSKVIEALQVCDMDELSNKIKAQL